MSVKQETGGSTNDPMQPVDKPGLQAKLTDPNRPFMRWLTFAAAIAAVVAIPLSIIASRSSTPTVQRGGSAAAPVREPDPTADVAAKRDDALGVALIEQPFACNGGARQFGFVTGAAPGETITFADDAGSDYLPGKADTSGRLVIQWECRPADAIQAVHLSAVGGTSGRRVAIAVVQVIAGTKGEQVVVSLDAGEKSFLATSPKVNDMTETQLANGEPVTVYCTATGPAVGTDSNWSLILRKGDAGFVPSAHLAKTSSSLPRCGPK
jgi:hypothetical protein